MGKPRFCSVNVVTPDVAAATEFLEGLGVEIVDTISDWVPHHRTFSPGARDVEAELDSPAFARWWGGASNDFSPGAVINFRTDTAAQVDELYARALELGATEMKAPWDAFWGSRHAVVRGPGPICVGFMNEPDDSRRTTPPAVDDFA